MTSEIGRNEFIEYVNSQFIERKTKELKDFKKLYKDNPEKLICNKNELKNEDWLYY
jgi:hypothetical protein